MKKTRRQKHTYGLKRYACTAAIVMLCAVIIKTVTALGGTRAASGLLESIVSGEGAAQRLIDFELNGSDKEGTALIARLIGASPEDSEHTAVPESPENTPEITDAYIPEEITPDSVVTDSPPSEEPSLYYTGVFENPAEPLDNSKPLANNGIVIKNSSGLGVDIDQLLSEPLNINISDDGPNVLIVHTHSSEAYTGDYVESDPYRTEDKTQNIIAVGDILAEKLSEYGLNVIHDRSVHDYPSYTGSYNRSLEAVRKHIQQYPEIDLVIDLHRDAMESASGKQLTTIAEIDGVRCAQIMLVVGTNGSGLTHPDWKSNLKLALRLQHEMNRSYPTLARPLTVSAHRYNQHLAPGHLIVEVGAAGNTLEEAKIAIEHFAKVYAAVALAGKQVID